MAQRKRAAPKTLAPEESDLFRRAVADAKPLASENRLPLERARRKPKPRPLEHDTESYDTLSDYVPASAAREPGEPVNFARPGLQRQVLRQLRRGGRAVEAELDLHGTTVGEARSLLVAFLVDSRERGLRCVRVIHGKGLRSENREGVLKTSVVSWLMQWEDVLAFTQAPDREGGAGAVNVLLRSGG